MLKVSSLLIGVRDLVAARPFYEKVFGFDFNEFRPPFASATLGGTEFNIEENAPYRSPDWAAHHIGTRKQFSFETDDLDSFLAAAQSAGARLMQVPEFTPWNWKEAVIADPDGNEFVIEQPL